MLIHEHYSTPFLKMQHLFYQAFYVRRSRLFRGEPPPHHRFFHFMSMSVVTVVRNMVRTIGNHVYGIGRSTVLMP